MRTTILLLSVVLSWIPTSAQQSQPPAQAEREHDVATRGDHVMGFSHESTSHHFYLLRDGGEIDVNANSEADKVSIAQIRMHLGHIANMFASGSFDAPMMIHDTNPPGVVTMTKLRGQIRYNFLETERGARIRIVTTAPEAIDAVHAFLLFQIIDHKTGDAPTISEQTPRT